MMASIAKMSVQLGWNGEEAEKGAASMQKSLAKVGEVAQATNKSMVPVSADQAKDDAIFAKKLANMNELQKQSAIAYREAQKRRMGMSAEEVKADLAKEKKGKDAEAFKESLKNMNALDREKALKDEATKKRRANMTADQIRADIEAEKKKEAAQAKSAGGGGGGMFTELLSGLTLAKAAFNTFVLGPIQATMELLKLGGQAQATRAKFGYLAGDVGKGAAAFALLRKQASDTGVPLENLTKAATNLVGLGFSAQAAGNILGRTKNAVEILGGGAAGAEAVAGAIGQIRSSAVLTEGPLQALQSQGLKVFEALAQELEAVTGNAYSVEEAMQKVRDGSVLAATGMSAVFRASNSKEAQVAAEAMGATFGSQIAKLKNGLTDLLTSIGETIIKAVNPEVVLASLRGAFEAIKIIVETIADNLGLALDPKKGQNLEKVFKTARDATFDIAEVVVRMGIDLAEAVYNIMRQIATVAAKIPSMAQNGFDNVLTELSELVGAVPKGTKETMRQMQKEEQQGQVKAVMPDLNFAKAQKVGLDAIANARLRAIAGDKAAAEAADKLGNINAEAAKKVNDLTKAEKKRIEDLEMLNRDVGKKAADLLRENATAAEEFNRKLTDSIAIFRQAAGVDPNLLGKLGKGLTRKVGKDLEQLIKEFGVAPDQNLPGAMSRGSSAAVEQEIRASMQLTTQDFETQLIAAAKNQERQSQLQVERLDKLVIAAEKAGIFAAAQLAEQKRAADAAKEAAAGKNKPVAVLPK
jgi:hypothetical protein